MCIRIKTEKEAEKAKVESRVKDIENEIREIESSMETYGSEFGELNNLYVKKDELGKKLDIEMEVWLSMN